jgi:hypothetical protein|tara:strand:+ start:1401 stop:2192 length:792 start_codon:yes stop_codon:yes gene_type:complete
MKLRGRVATRPIAESTHWYDRNGKPCYTVIGANGKERNTTLRDARKENFVPSVTTIIGMAAKPQLENWKIDQALLSALTLPRLTGEPEDEFMARAKMDAKEQTYAAADRGTQIHAVIESGFSGENRAGFNYAPYLAVKKILDELFPNADPWIAEDSFAHINGFGGKIDLYNNQGIFVDFKTKDNLEGKDPKKLVYDEHGMQLSAYAEGMEFSNPKRVSIFIDRNDVGLALYHIWDEESHQRHLGMFSSLLAYWQLFKKYKPEL